ncbi:hypothetical protein HHI36_019345 [Cryptolaemus montrouzieri]|uniref:Uncharacterized protein n=1 Tax=Cryptolaemus montrouzieri TaxID=559131 RepID=A0ABD2P3B3_9CUCU
MTPPETRLDIRQNTLRLQIRFYLDSDKFFKNFGQYTQYTYRSEIPVILRIAYFWNRNDMSHFPRLWIN